MLLIKGGNLYSPKHVGIRDLLISQGVEKIGTHLDMDCEVIDAEGKLVTPGLIDRHIHVIGGGGEGGFLTQSSRVEPLDLIQGGLTSVVGLLGTDGITRNVDNLVAYAKALKEYGFSVYCMTGSYGYPPVTLTGSVGKDIVFIDEILGCKLALSDHRSSHISYDELLRLASEVRTAGMIGKKVGCLTLHMGDEPYGLDQVFEILKKTSVPVKTFQPTHISRNEKLFEQACEFAKQGGTIDLTCDDPEKTAQALEKAMERKVPWDKITISSDGQGSWSQYDKVGNLIKIGTSPVDSIYKQIKYLCQKKSMEFEKALALGTINVATALELYPKKGSLKEHSDADLLIWNRDLSLDTVIAKGKVLMRSGSPVE